MAYDRICQFSVPQQRNSGGTLAGLVVRLKVIGFLTGLAWLYAFTFIRVPWIVHAAAIVCGAAGLAVIVLQPRRRHANLARSSGESGSNGFRACISGCVAGLAFATAAGVAMACLVLHRAAAAADGAPYCLQVADATTADYRRASSLFDLSALTMWAGRESGIYMQHHAILVVGGETKSRLFHWSYHQWEFVEGVLNETSGRGPLVTCDPTRTFAGGLLFPRSSDSELVRFSAEEAYRIPKTYQPRWGGGSGRHLRLATSAPEFLALGRRAASLALGFDDWVWVAWDRDWFLRLLEPSPGRPGVAQGIEFGLQKSLFVAYGKNGERYESYGYVARADGQTAGVNTTLITCSPATENRPNSCQHRFLNGGRHFDFRHRPADLPNWLNLQKRLLELFASFEAAADVPSSR